MTISKPFLGSVAGCALISTVIVVSTRDIVRATGQGKNAADGVYTEAQSTRGQELYGKMCSSCHGDKLDGTAMAPTLSGQDFLGGWNDRTAADLNEKIQTTMPADKAGSLTPEQSADLVAYLLKVNTYPAGATELAPGAGLAEIRLKGK